MKLLCLIFYKIIAQYLPHTFWPGGKLFSEIRRVTLIGMGCEIGKRCEIEPHVDVGFRPNVKIGYNCQLNNNISIKSAIIGNYVMIAPGAVLLDRSHKHDQLDIPMIQQGETDKNGVIISDNVWIGQNAILMPGIEIGEGAIIGAGAVVTKNIPDYAVATGVPARVTYFRSKK